MDKLTIVLFGKRYNATVTPITTKKIIVEFPFKLNDLHSLLELSENEEIELELKEGIRKVKVLFEPALVKGDKGHHASLHCKLIA